MGNNKSKQSVVTMTSTNIAHTDPDLSIFNAETHIQRDLDDYILYNTACRTLWSYKYHNIAHIISKYLSFKRHGTNRRKLSTNHDFRQYFLRKNNKIRRLQSTTQTMINTLNGRRIKFLKNDKQVTYIIMNLCKTHNYFIDYVKNLTNMYIARRGYKNAPYRLESLEYKPDKVAYDTKYTLGCIGTRKKCAYWTYTLIPVYKKLENDSTGSVRIA